MPALPFGATRLDPAVRYRLGMRSNTPATIRQFRPADTESTVALWEACGLTRPWNDPRADIARALGVQPELFLVAEGDASTAAAGSTAAGSTATDGSNGADGSTGTAEPAPSAAPQEPGEIVGSVMAGYDGHRGWMYYLAAAPSHRGLGIGRALVAEVERRLEALGCPKAQLMVRSDNAAAVGFYSELGYEVNDVLVLGKRLIADA